MLTESTLLAFIGGVVGAVIAYYGVGVLVAYGPTNIPLLAESRVNLPAICFALGISLLTGIVCGLFPALQAYRKEASAALQEVTRGSVGGRGASRFRRVLVGVEMALGTALLALAGLLLHSLFRVIGTDRGYAVERVLAVDLAPSGQRYASDQQRVAFYRELIERIRSIPGVIAAGAISTLPAGQETGTSTIFYVDDTNPKSVVLQRPVAGIRFVTPGYFAASGSVLRAGRFFAEAENAPAALVSETLAKRLWPADAPSLVVGRQLRVGDVTGPPITVAGVVGDFRTGALDREPLPQIYRPHEQAPRGSMSVVVRTAQEPASLAGALRAEVRKVAPDIPMPAVRTMREILSAAVAPRRFQVSLISLFALLALLLAAVGIYGVVSYSVACRTREIGLRLALGAKRADVMEWVFSHGMQPVLIGLLVGLGGAIAIARVLRSLLFGITPSDPISLGTVALVLLLTSGLACYLPAHRAARLDPMVALRHE